MQLPAAKGRNLRGAKRNLQWQLGMGTQIDFGGR